MEARNFIMI